MISRFQNNVCVNNGVSYLRNISNVDSSYINTYTCKLLLIDMWMLIKFTCSTYN